MSFSPQERLIPYSHIYNEISGEFYGAVSLIDFIRAFFDNSKHDDNYLRSVLTGLKELGLNHHIPYLQAAAASLFIGVQYGFEACAGHKQKHNSKPQQYSFLHPRSMFTLMGYLCRATVPVHYFKTVQEAKLSTDPESYTDAIPKLWGSYTPISNGRPILSDNLDFLGNGNALTKVFHTRYESERLIICRTDIDQHLRGSKIPDLLNPNLSVRDHSRVLVEAYAHVMTEEAVMSVIDLCN